MTRLYVGSIFQYTQDEVSFRPPSPVYEYPSLYIYDDGDEVRDCTEIDAEYGIEDGRIIVIRDDLDLKQVLLHQVLPQRYTLYRFRPESTIWIGEDDA